MQNSASPAPGPGTMDEPDVNSITWSINSRESSINFLELTHFFSELSYVNTLFFEVVIGGRKVNRISLRDTDNSLRRGGRGVPR